MLQLTQELSYKKTYNFELVKQVVMGNEQIQGLKEALDAEKRMIPIYQEEAIINYKAFIRFIKGLERLGCSFIVVQVLCYLNSFKDKVL